MTHSKLFDFGSSLVLANRGKSRSEFNHRQGVLDRLLTTGGAFHNEVCKIAAAAYEADDMGNSVQFHLFTKLAAVRQWHAELNRFTLPVLSALHRFADREVAVRKSAGAVAALPFVANKIGAPDTVKLLLALGAIPGIGMGSLGFLLSRDSRESSAENNAITEKTRAYKQLRRDIEEDLSASGALEPAVSKSRFSL